MDGNIHIKIFQPSDCLTRQEIQAYLEGELSAGNRLRFENHLLDCPLCADAVEGYGENDVQVFASLPDFSDFQKKIPVAESAKVRRLIPARMQVRLVAVAVVFALAIAAYLNWFRPESSETLYNQFYASYKNDIPFTRSSGEEDFQPLDPVLKNALEQYTAGNYAASQPLFDQALVAEPENDAARFFNGMACLETGQWEKALQLLDNVRQKNGIYAPAATWYLALAHVKMEKKEEAKSLLNVLSKNGGPIGQEAEKLLKKL